MRAVTFCIEFHAIRCQLVGPIDITCRRVTSRVPTRSSGEFFGGSTNHSRLDYTDRLDLALRLARGITTVALGGIASRGHRGDFGSPIVGKPPLDSKRGKDVMQQVTGQPRFHYANMRTQALRAADSQSGRTLWQ